MVQNVIGPARMVGRIETATWRIMRMYNLAVARAGIDPLDLLPVLAGKVDSEDCELCLRMADELGRCRQELADHPIPENEKEGQASLGAMDANLVFQKYPGDYAHHLLEQRDFVAEAEEALRQRKAERKRNILLALGCVAVLVLGIVIYNLPYFAEKRAYGRVEKAYEQKNDYEFRKQAGEYAEDYPDGRHIDDVLWLVVTSDRSLHEPIKILESAENYLTLRPEGSYAARAKAVYDSVWNSEIANYDRIADKRGSDAGSVFVRSMLCYMRDNRMHTVSVTGVPTLDLKEYSEYPANIRALLEALYEAEAESAVVIPGRKSAKLPDDLVTIKDKITPEQTRSWTSDVILSLQSGFDRVLTPGLVKFVDSGTVHDSDKAKLPTVRVDFTVNTEEEHFGDVPVPSIWTYTSTQGYNIEVEKSFILGISMEFKADFNYPGAPSDFVVTGHGDPGEERINVDKSEAYNVMCDRCVAKFADKIAAEIGLPEQ